MYFVLYVCRWFAIDILTTDIFFCWNMFNVWDIVMLWITDSEFQSRCGNQQNRTSRSIQHYNVGQSLWIKYVYVRIIFLLCWYNRFSQEPISTMATHVERYPNDWFYLSQSCKYISCDANETVSNKHWRSIRYISTPYIVKSTEWIGHSRSI